MAWTKLHSILLSSAFDEALGEPEQGAVAYVRCLTPDVVEELAADHSFSPTGWEVHLVSDANVGDLRSITADHAVEIRESKSDPVLLLVDTDRAGAGMDGIYSAAQEIHESGLFKHALRIAYTELKNRLSNKKKESAELAIKKGRGFGGRFNLSPWTEFDFLVRIIDGDRNPGDLLYLLGLWPVKQKTGADLNQRQLDDSRRFVDRLLGSMASGTAPSQRIDGLKLSSDDGIKELNTFLHSTANKPLLQALADLAETPSLWINSLEVEEPDNIKDFELIPWRTQAKRIAGWSGLVEVNPTNPPVLNLNPDADKNSKYAKLEIRWKSTPDNLTANSVEYRVVVKTDMDEELASQVVTHSGKREEKCRFTDNDFSMLNEDALIGATVVVSVIGNDSLGEKGSEDFTIRFGSAIPTAPSSAGRKFRALSEGLIDLADREAVTNLVNSWEGLEITPNEFVSLRTPDHQSIRVNYPPLIRDVDNQWPKETEAIGRWRVKVRGSGARAESLEYVPLSDSLLPETTKQSLWSRVEVVSRRMAKEFASHGGVGQIYDEKSKFFDTIVKEYMLAWAALLEEGDPALSLANTVEIQTLSGRTIGIIVLPSHPLRVAWHVAYDNLVLGAKFMDAASSTDILKEFATLDGSMFPTFLPGLDETSSFVFADTLGFHGVAMVLDNDQEPKAAVAILARAMGENETAETVPTVENQSAQILGNELLKYVEAHETPRILHVHALRPGDGLTVARALGRVHEVLNQESSEDAIGENEEKATPAFVLELYPSNEQRGVAGRFIAEAREKRRSGAGVLAEKDRWMLESISLPAGVNMPRLRWARKAAQEPQSAAHIAIAFDTFESQVVSTSNDTTGRPLFAFGLLSFLDRKYTNSPSPMWIGTPITSTVGEKHPSDRAHTERLVRLEQVVSRCVSLSLGPQFSQPTLKTELLPDKAHNLRELHRLSDWVITIDRNVGIEYFDSPGESDDVYNAYVIDCVPEREDMGSLQMITSTSKFDEVRNLLDKSLDQMGLSQSRRNAAFLLNRLKAVSGRLAMRLTGRNAPTSELIALALSQANCLSADENDNCWTNLRSGFLIPVDDVRDLFPWVGRRSLIEDAVEESSAGNVRPDLIHVSIAPRKGLQFRFIEVKYRRHLRVARSSDLLEGIRRQTQTLRNSWNQWYFNKETSPSFLAVRRAKLARVLRFYADKANRHSLSESQYEILCAEIDRMVEKGGDYSFTEPEGLDRGWIFCPDYSGQKPTLVSPSDWDTKVFLFGPNMLPDSGFRPDLPPGTTGQNENEPIKLGNPGADDDEGVEEDNEPQQTPVSEAEPENVPDSAISEISNNQPADESAPDGNILSLGIDSFTREPVEWSLTIKGNPHLLVAGLPGMGKTTFLLNLCRQMLEVDVRPIIFSYHEDLEESLEKIVPAVRYIDFSGLGFNPLQVIDRQSHLAYLDVAGALRDIFTAIYPELGDIQGEAIRKAIKESFVECGWDNPEANPETLVEPAFGRFVEILRDEPKPDRGLRTLLGRLEELDDYGFFKTNEIEKSMWEGQEPIVIRIHKTQNDNLQKAFASMVFYGLYKDMFRRGIQQRITHVVVFDEAHRAARLKLIPTMAKECRKYGISLVLASQEAKDFNASLFSAIANYLVLRMNEADAKAFMRNVASSDQERMLVDKIKQMDRFKAIYFSEGNRKPSQVDLLP